MLLTSSPLPMPAELMLPLPVTDVAMWGCSFAAV